MYSYVRICRQVMVQVIFGLEILPVLIQSIEYGGTWNVGKRTLYVHGARSPAAHANLVDGPTNFGDQHSGLCRLFAGVRMLD